MKSIVVATLAIILGATGLVTKANAAPDGGSASAPSGTAASGVPIKVNDVPEPASLAMFGMAAAGLAVFLYRRRGAGRPLRPAGLEPATKPL